MMTLAEVRALVVELNIEDKKTKKVPVYYKRHGQMVRRSFDDRVPTERYLELLRLLDSEEAKVFVCEDCGERITCFQAASWCYERDDDVFGDYNFGVFDAMERDGYVICSCCLEARYGEDI